MNYCVIIKTLQSTCYSEVTPYFITCRMPFAFDARVRYNMHMGYICYIISGFYSV